MTQIVSCLLCESKNLRKQVDTSITSGPTFLVECRDCGWYSISY